MFELVNIVNLNSINFIYLLNSTIFMLSYDSSMKITFHLILNSFEHSELFSIE